ncbi:MAG: Gfo/Idh/MocA family oxidoreductase [Oligoflexia bacterium]|nr:Gfo/Idh/MocA family oxidoreductase [Oligoflexia bacterium]
MSEKLLRVGLVGHGHLGKWHGQKIHAHEMTNFTCIVEPNEKAWADIKKSYPEINLVRTVSESLELCDAYIVSSPTIFHHEITKELLSNGKHVFCEKPLTSTYDQAKEVNSLAKEKNLVLQVGHSERCHEAWEKLDLISKFTSNPSIVNLTRVAPFKGRATDVDVVQDLLIHDIDLLLYLFKTNPMAVTATGEKIRTKHWDYVEAVFEFEGNLKATIIVGRNNIEEVRSLEVINAQGMARVDLMNRVVKVADKDSNEVETVLEYEGRDHLAIEQDHFYHSILKNKEVFVDGDAGVKAVFYVNKVLESLEKKERVLCQM